MFEGLQGHLQWTIKSEFRNYVLALPDGKETWLSSEGRLTGEGYVFDLVSARPIGSNYLLSFAGAIRFFGYRGMLRVDISDPQVEILQDLTVLITVNTSLPEQAPSRIQFAHGKLASEMVHGNFNVDVVKVTLTEEGAALLGGVYQAGVPASDLHVRVTVAEPLV